MEHLNRKLQQLLLEKIALDNSLMTSLPKSILQEAIQGKLVPQIVKEGTAKELLDQIKEEKEKLVKQGKLKKSALNDGVIFRGDDNKYYEQIGKQYKDITEEINTKDNVELLYKYINKLTKREKEIIIRRYGLFNNKEMTQKEIAKEMMISRSYVSRIEKRAISKILTEFIKSNKTL